MKRSLSRTNPPYQSQAKRNERLSNVADIFCSFTSHNTYYYTVLDIIIIHNDIEMK